MVYSSLVHGYAQHHGIQCWQAQFFILHPSWRRYFEACLVIARREGFR